MTTLTITPHGRLALNRRQLAAVIKNFTEGGTTHSKGAGTLQHVLDHCHANGVPYRLMAAAGRGYRVEPLRDDRPVDGALASATDILAALATGKILLVDWRPETGYLVSDYPDLTAVAAAARGEPPFGAVEPPPVAPHR